MQLDGEKAKPAVSDVSHSIPIIYIVAQQGGSLFMPPFA